MKSKSLFVVCTALAMSLCPAGAFAEAPAPVKMDAATLGRLDALLTLCSKADAKHKSTYERVRSEMIVFAEGTDHEMRAPGGDTPEYKEAYAAMVEAAGKTSKKELVAECSRFIGAEGAK